MRCLLPRLLSSTAASRVCSAAAALRCPSRDPPRQALNMTSAETLLRPMSSDSGSSSVAKAAPADVSHSASHQRRQRRAGSAASGGNKRWKNSRPWQPRRPEEESAREAGQETSEPAEKRARLGSKRKVALLVAYNGSGYQGLQIQTGSERRTIEAELSQAIHKAGGMLASNLSSLSKVSWQRCARTDKGVHAACNVISLQLIVDPSRSIVARINGLLPPAVRVLSCQPVMGSFHAKHSCTSRVYHYLVPSYLFDSAFSEHIDIDRAKQRGREDEQRRLLYFQHSLQQQQPASTQSPRPLAESDDDGAEEEQAEADSEAEAGELPAAPEPEAVSVSEECRQRLLSYRLPDSLRSTVEAVLRRFEGSHNFYNFTRHKSIRNREDRRDQTPAAAELKAESESAPQQPSGRPSRWQRAAGPLLPVNRDFQADRNSRCILSCGIAQTFVYAPSGLQLAVLRVHGQSFMLNQIRKMVAAAVIVARGLVDGDELLPRVFAERGVYLPTAPSLGLYLDRPLFELYDQRCLRQQQDESERSSRGGAAAAEAASAQPAIERKTVQQLYDELDADIQAFRRDHIYPGICDEESSNLSAYRWLAGISLHPSLWPTQTAEQPGPPSQQRVPTE